MEHMSPHSPEQREETESIWNRTEIDAPVHFVSLYHNTGFDDLRAIDAQGLKNGLAPSDRSELDSFIDDQRPGYLQSIGASRSSIYASLDKERSAFAPQRHKESYRTDVWLAHLLERKREELQRDRDYLSRQAQEQSGQPREVVDAAVKLHTASPYDNMSEEEFRDRMRNDSDFAKEFHGERGELLELKVDPDKCLVVDVDDVNRVIACLKDGDEEGAAEAARDYWEGAEPLSRYLQHWTLEREEEEGYVTYRWARKPDAPEDVRGYYEPEVLIPTDVPQKHIRVVR